MTIVSHLDQLKQKHHNLEGQLAEAMRHPSTSDQEIARIKREKLVLKEKIDKISN
ncbi:MAG: DUF465 domain-containing protein [Salaquimonas sp.]